MSRYKFDCHHHNGYTGCCDLKGGECHKVCKHFITEAEWLDSIPEYDLRVSVAKLRYILESFVSEQWNESIVDEIINQVKKSI